MTQVRKGFWIGAKPVHPEITKLQNMKESYTYCRVELGASAEDMREMEEDIQKQEAIVAALPKE